ncbi:MAG: hypothetical protein J6K58_06800 [Lachnospiraceae bacterium]|nr:hypothetical protein [Lachnospiraceae bacterium]MBP3458900.1 hypothetical protein [Lachnospiraceae bacterium]
MNYVVAQEIKSETKVTKHIYLFDMFFILIYYSVSFALGVAVHEKWKIPFYLFSMICAVFLTAKSWTNRKRRNIESIILFLQRDKEVYFPVANHSKEVSKKQEERQQKAGRAFP